MDRSKKTSTQAGKPLEKGDTFRKGIMDEASQDTSHSVGDEFGAPMWSHEHDAGLDEHPAEVKAILPMHEATDFDCSDGD